MTCPLKRGQTDFSNASNRCVVQRQLPYQPQVTGPALKVGVQLALLFVDREAKLRTAPRSRKLHMYVAAVETFF